MPRTNKPSSTAQLNDLNDYCEELDDRLAEIEDTLYEGTIPVRINLTDTDIELYTTHPVEDGALIELARLCQGVEIQLDLAGRPTVVRIPRPDVYEDDEPQQAQPPIRRQVDRSKPRQLQLFRGPAEIIYHRADPRWRGITRRDAIAWCAAYDIEHALELIEKYRVNPEFTVPLTTLRSRWTLGWPDFDHEPTEPGLWIAFTPEGKVERIV